MLTICGGNAKLPGIIKYEDGCSCLTKSLCRDSGTRAGFLKSIKVSQNNFIRLLQ